MHMSNFVRLLSVVLLLSVAGSVHAQNILVAGKVTSKTTGEGLAAASVLVKGTNINTVTNDSGRYTLSLPAGGGTLVVSYIGMTTQEIPATTAGEYDVTLDDGASTTLSDLVVVGYGTQRRSNVTGAIATVKTKELVQTPVADLSNALIGRVPGIVTKQGSGEPGADNASLFIRGVSTFAGSTEPLFVVDGIVRTGRDFAQLDANEVESISILKDASSAAIYGVRGANGVIQVTTKRGKAGKTTTSYSFNYGLTEVTKFNDNLGSYEYATLLAEAQFNDGVPITYSPAEIEAFRTGSDPVLYPNTDWQRLVLGGTATQMQHNLNFSGGTDKTKYFASLGYFDQDGLYSSLGYKRYNLRLNLDIALTNTTKIGIDLSGRLEKRTAPTTGISGIFEHTLRNPPTIPAYYEGVGYAQIGSYTNPLRGIDPAAGYNNTENNTILTNLFIEQQIPWVRGLSLKGVFAYDKRMNYTKRWNDNVYTYTADGAGGYVQSNYQSPSLQEEFYQQTQTELQAQLNYNRRFNKHGVSALVLLLQQERPNNYFGAGRSGYENGIFQTLDVGPATNTNGDITEFIYGNKDRFALRSFAARVNYDYDNKYLFQASIRADETENFAPDYRRGYFPAFSAGWIVSSEEFMDGTKGTLDFLKLKGSWGKLGNDQVGQRFGYISRYQGVSNNYPFGGTILPGLNPLASNPVIQWEESAKADIGFEARFLKGMFDIDVDFFRENRTKILGFRYAQIPSAYGGALPPENVGEVLNKGVEVNIGHTKTINRDWSYFVRANMTYTKNKIVEAPIAANTPNTFNPVGRAIGSFFGYKAIGIIRDQATLDAYNVTTEFPVGLGDIMYEDVDKDGVINANDRQYLTTGTIPQIVYGISGGARWKGFEFSILFQGADKVNQQLTNNAGYAFFNGGRVSAEWLDRWSPANPDGKLPRLSTNATATTNNYQVPGGPAYSNGGNSFWIKDAAYLRLKNMEIAYNFAPALIRKAGMSNLRVFATGQNLVTWTKLRNVDPETTNTSGWYYPVQAVYNFGINLQF
ncbi:MAG: TonB-dependent receptor [Chitinophagaceae bacterium]|nr:MAG: TonB-dependent receptor [Chitinophagaceae bacterium]